MEPAIVYSFLWLCTVFLVSLRISGGTQQNHPKWQTTTESGKDMDMKTILFRKNRDAESEKKSARKSLIWLKLKSTIFHKSLMKVQTKPAKVNVFQLI